MVQKDTLGNLLMRTRLVRIRWEKRDTSTGLLSCTMWVRAGNRFVVKRGEGATPDEAADDAAQKITDFLVDLLKSGS